MNLFKEKIRISLIVLSLLTGCASNVKYLSTDIRFSPVSVASSPKTLDKQVDVFLPTGYTRTLKAGSQWLHVGTVSQGEVYKPHKDVFTLEGAHVHEAYLVVSSNSLVGFYLPVEHGFSSLDQHISLTFN